MNAAAAIHAISLAACFAAHLAFAAEFDGVRRALQTMAGQQAQTIITAHSADASVLQRQAS